MTKKISELDSATTPLGGTETVEVVQGGVSKKVAVSYFGGSGGGREILSSARTYYVRTDGSDLNDGLANTSGGAFLTIQKAIDVSCSIDMSIYQVTIQVGDGTYTGASSLKSYIGALPPIIQGNLTTPENVVISTTSAPCFILSTASTWSIKDLKVQTTTSGSGFESSLGGSLILSGINYGSCASDHIRCIFGGIVSITGAYTISGGAAAHFGLQAGGIILMYSQTITLSGTPAFSAGFVYATSGGMYSGGTNTWSGSATGSRYNISINATVNTNGAGALHFPGNSAGTTATGGQYA